MKIIKEEVDKLLAAGYIRPVQYPEWLANVVLVPKSNKKWRMCIDFTNLNRACPKDSYPFLRIDALVESTVGSEIMRFLDAFQGYNQISLEPQDQEKISFVTEQGIFCYRVMPFGLKNAGATYQRLVNKVFKYRPDETWKCIRRYTCKSQIKDNYIRDLQECFDVIRGLGMKLNPSNALLECEEKKFLAT
ncbi:UNVERIFIED_CONTAM: Transposon Ty3-G Gag-Pol polyprotein [Sesamum latifolium]|uniref:Transposon Ty3-G Gag-Pol polyprotein n=1 Tax=Sesamum latifolium TaxID=2727402 RepID=A0AAW2WFS6_9LAMI